MRIDGGSTRASILALAIIGCWQRLRRPLRCLRDTSSAYAQHDCGLASAAMARCKVRLSDAKENMGVSTNNRVRENDMIKNAWARVRRVLPLAIAMVAGAGCGAEGGLRGMEAAKAQTASRMRAQLDPADGLAAPPPASADLRHFDAYQRYRSIFETSGDGGAADPSAAHGEK
jgi:hypothetical protein